MKPSPTQPVAIVTGANSGIGRVTARELALRGYHVFLACRSEERTRPVLAEIQTATGGKGKAEFVRLDLGSLDSVRACAEEFLRRGLPLQLLVANAGIAGVKGLTESGFEMSFGTCHVGHFLLTNLLLQRMKESAPARVVVVSSRAHRHTRTLDWEAVRRPTRGQGLKAYSLAKLANLLFAKELARRLAGTGVTTYALHPGVVATNVWRAVPWPADRIAKWFMVSEEEGAATTLYCATEPALAAQSGLYYVNCKETELSRTAQNSQLALALWEKSEQWTGLAPEV
jgi:NAD(P)-dependent dehydrogenase (short-subunit alcohol dehydrogenase family)